MFAKPRLEPSAAGRRGHGLADMSA